MLWVGIERETDEGRRSLAWETFKRDPSIVLFNDPPGNGKTKSHSTGIAATSLISAVEPLEDMWHILWCNPYPRVTYQHFNECALALQSQRHPSISRGILERVVEEDQ